jgi:hypothetical protein
VANYDLLRVQVLLPLDRYIQVQVLCNEYIIPALLVSLLHTPLRYEPLRETSPSTGSAALLMICDVSPPLDKLRRPLSCSNMANSSASPWTAELPDMIRARTDVGW